MPINAVIDGGTILFPLAYIIGDVVTEVYGFRKAKQLIMIGFAMSILASTTLYLVQIMPPATIWEHQAAYEAILGTLPRIIIGSLVAYLVGELLNSFILAKLKVRTNGKYLWVRTIGSTIVGALADTAIFSTIAFLGTIPNTELSKLIIVVYFIKVVIEIIVTPVTYRVVAWLKSVEGIDYFDRDLTVKNSLLD